MTSTTSVYSCCWFSGRFSNLQSVLSQIHLIHVFERSPQFILKISNNTYMCPHCYPSISPCVSCVGWEWSEIRVHVQFFHSHQFSYTVEARMISPTGIMGHFPKLHPDVYRFDETSYNQTFTSAILHYLTFDTFCNIKYTFRFYTKYSKNISPMWMFAFKTHLQ